MPTLSCTAWPPYLQHLPMELIAAALADDVHSAARASTVLRRKSVHQHLHFLHGEKWKRAENRLPAPTVVAGGAGYFKPRLAASRSIRSEQILIDEDVTLISSWPVGCVQQWKGSDLAVEKRRLLHLLFLQLSVQLWFLTSNFSSPAAHLHPLFSTPALSLHIHLSCTSPNHI